MVQGASRADSRTGQQRPADHPARLSAGDLLRATGVTVEVVLEDETLSRHFPIEVRPVHRVKWSATPS